MGNLITKIQNIIIEQFDYSKSNFIKKIFNNAKRLKIEKDKFIKNNLNNIYNNINGGISSGVSSSYKIYKNKKY